MACRVVPALSASRSPLRPSSLQGIGENGLPTSQPPNLSLAALAKCPVLAREHVLLLLYECQIHVDARKEVASLPSICRWLPAGFPQAHLHRCRHVSVTTPSGLAPANNPAQHGRIAQPLPGISILTVLNNLWLNLAILLHSHAVHSNSSQQLS